MSEKISSGTKKDQTFKFYPGMPYSHVHIDRPVVLTTNQHKNGGKGRNVSFGNSTRARVNV